MLMWHGYKKKNAGLSGAEAMVAHNILKRNVDSMEHDLVELFRLLRERVEKLECDVRELSTYCDRTYSWSSDIGAKLAVLMDYLEVEIQDLPAARKVVKKEE